MEKMKYVSANLLCLALALLAVSCSGMTDLSSGLGAGSDALTAATLSDDDVIKEANSAIAAYDARHEIAEPGSKYGERLNNLVGNIVFDEGMNPNFKVYILDEVNAFAMADGSIRLFSGLMDMMNDDELLFVIGHELGHVKLGHRKKALKLAYAASAARKGAASQGGTTGAVASSSLGDFTEKLINAQFSQSEERAADDYGVQFLVKNNGSKDGAVTTLQKLAKLGGGHGIFSSHPDPEKRAQRIADES